MSGNEKAWAPGVRSYKKDPKVKLVYPPHQSLPGTMVKPNGSLAYPMLAGALLEHGLEVEVFDACVGNHKDDLKETFYRPSALPSGLLRTGVSNERILEEVADSDVIGLTSIFSDQESMVLRTARLIKKAYPEKLVIAGGVNARNRLKEFFTSGVDIICLSEAEKTIQQIMDVVRRGSRDFSGISAVAYKDGNRLRLMGGGEFVVNRTRSEDIIWDLDELPMPAWHLLPNERYWEISRPHSGHFESGKKIRYAMILTSLGCVFTCQYCHIAGETEGNLSGPIGKFRMKSDERVLAEIDELKRLEVDTLFVSDDTLFGRKERGIRLLRKIRGAGLYILDINGVNLIHLFKHLSPDKEVIEAMIEAGFGEIALSFESGSQRLIKKYATNKWDVEKHDVIGLIRLCKQYGLTLAGNYMLGYPEETKEEMHQTIDMARRHREAGLDSANFFAVIPLPGTPLFDMALREGYLRPDFDPDRFNYQKANLINTVVPAEEVEVIRSRAWEELNDSGYVAYKRAMVVTSGS